MKLIFGFNKLPRCSTNNGVQFFYLEGFPMKIGDNVKIIYDSYPFLRTSFQKDKLYKITSIKKRDTVRENEKNIVISIDDVDYCASWAIPVNSIWKKL